MCEDRTSQGEAMSEVYSCQVVVLDGSTVSIDMTVGDTELPRPETSFSQNKMLCVCVLLIEKVGG